jgi:hypothetical protein
MATGIVTPHIPVCVSKLELEKIFPTIQTTASLDITNSIK